jgi:glycosyltransferase 2 family protein
MSAPPVSKGQSRARVTGIVAALLGLAVATAVIGYFNVGAVLKAIAPIGVGGFLAVVAAQVVLFAPLGFAWWLVAPCPAGTLPVFMGGRLSREAASDVLPFSSIGGLVIAARVAVLGGVTSSVSFGSCVVDISVEMVAQLIYTLIGVALLAHRLGGFRGHGQLLWPVLASLAIAVSVAGSFIATQKRGLDVIERLVQRMIPSAAEQTAAVAQVISEAYNRPVRLAVCLVIHVMCWFGAAAGTWLILDFIGHPLPFWSVVAIESLLFAIRNAAFVVPSGLGVQEGSYALLGPLFGLPAEAALALSLLKRARDIVIGVPVLLLWQLAEGRRSLREA